MYDIHFGIYFIVVELLLAYFYINLFVAIMFSCFTDCWMKEYKLVQENKQVQKYFDYLEQIEFINPDWEFYKPPSNKLQKLILKVVLSKYFENFIILIILLNILILGSTYEGSSLKYQKILEYINLAFTIVFILEVILKIYGLNIRGFFIHSWNQFDFFVVVTSIIDITVYYSINQNSQFLKSFQILRVLRLLRVSKYSLYLHIEY